MAGAVVEQEYFEILKSLRLEGLQTALQVLFTLPEQDHDREKGLVHVHFHCYVYYSLSRECARV